ncbi:MAG: gamma carbonic anhydrase family protein [Pseudomonadota bacterium]|jgi:carbonic anhydrase/acetyltransferase-like protein (isoleucine patch superfamily)
MTGRVGKGGLYPFDGKWPVVAADVFIAPGARVIGDVKIGAGSSIWFNCVVRGDVNAIRIGAGTNIQDGTVVHVTRKTHETHIGDHCLIGHQAMIHGCLIEDYSFIGLGATVMDGCVIETDGMLAAGALLTPGKRVGRGELWAGHPAKRVRALSPEEVAGNRAAPQGYAALAQSYRRALSNGR